MNPYENTTTIPSIRKCPSDIQQLRGPLVPRREGHRLLQRQAFVQGDRAHDQRGAWPQVIHCGPWDQQNPVVHVLYLKSSRHVG